MTAREAALALMAKDPHSPTIRLMKKEGLLNQVLYPQRASSTDPWSRQPKIDETIGGTVKRIRSISKPSETSSEGKPWTKANKPVHRDYTPRVDGNVNNIDRRSDNFADYDIDFSNFKISSEDQVKPREKVTSDSGNLDR